MSPVLRRLLSTMSPLLRTYLLVGGALLWLLGSPAAEAGLCTSSDCIVNLNDSNFVSGNNFGTVELKLTSTNLVTVSINLNSNYRIINTGFPGVAGFNDTLGGGLTIGNFSNSGYSGFLSSPSGCTSNDCHWDGFGYANNAAGISGPKRKNSVQNLSFTVSGNSSFITNVNQLLALFNPAGGEGPAYFVVDACLWVAKNNSCSFTGLFAANSVPEPASLAILATGLLALAILRRKKRI